MWDRVRTVVMATGYFSDPHPEMSLADDGDVVVTLEDIYKAAMEANIEEALVRMPEGVLLELHQRLLQDLVMY